MQDAFARVLYAAPAGGAGRGRSAYYLMRALRNTFYTTRSAHRVAQVGERGAPLEDVVAGDPGRQAARSGRSRCQGCTAIDQLQREDFPPGAGGGGCASDCPIARGRARRRGSVRRRSRRACSERVGRSPARSINPPRVPSQSRLISSTEIRHDRWRGPIAEDLYAGTGATAPRAERLESRDAQAAGPQRHRARAGSRPSSR